MRGEITSKSYSCGVEDDPQVGETIANFLYLQFLSDGSGTGKGFRLTYNTYKGNSIIRHIV